MAHRIEIYRTRIEDAPTPTSITRTVIDRLLLSDKSSLIGAAYYISPNGDDIANDGLSYDSPWETFSKARGEMAAGEIKTTYLLGGVYNRAVPLVLGSDDSNTRWLGYPGETPIIDGNDSDIELFDCNGANNVTWKDITFTNNYEPPSTPSADAEAWPIKLVNCSGCIVEGCTFDEVRGAIFLSGTSDNAKILGNTFSTVGYRAIRAQDGPQDGIVAGNTANNMGVHSDIRDGIAFHAANAGLFSARTIDGWTFEYNYVNHCAGSAYTSNDIGSGSNTNHTFRYNVIYSTNLIDEGEDGAGIYLDGRSGQDANCTITENWCEGIGGKTVFGRISGDPTPDVTADKAMGVYGDDAEAGMTVTKNVVIDAVLASFFTHSGQDNIFDNNICLIVADADNANGQLFGGAQLHQYSIWTNRNSEYPPGGDPAGTMTGITFRKNIVVSIAAPTGAPGANGWSVASYDNGGASYNDHTLEFETPGVTVQNNVLHSDIDLASSSSTDRGVYSRAGIGDETSSTQGDPLFNDLANRDLSLDVGSPAYSEGFIDIPGVTDGGTFTWGSPTLNANSGYDRNNY